MRLSNSFRSGVLLALALVGILAIVAVPKFSSFVGHSTNDFGMRASAAQRALDDATSSRDWKKMVSVLGTRRGIGTYDQGPNGKIIRELCEVAQDRLVTAGKAGGDAVIALGLNSEDVQIRFLSMKVLGRLKDRSYVPGIISRLSRESDPCVLVLGAEALCSLGAYEQAKPYFRKVLPNCSYYLYYGDNERFPTIREKALSVMREYGPELGGNWVYAK